MSGAVKAGAGASPWETTLFPGSRELYEKATDFFKPQPQALSKLQDYLFTKRFANWSHTDAIIDCSPCLFGLRCVISTFDSLLLKTETNYPSRMADTLTILCLAAVQSIQTPLASQFLFCDALSSIYHQQLYRIQRTLLITSYPACNTTDRGF